MLAKGCFPNAFRTEESKHVIEIYTEEKKKNSMLFKAAQQLGMVPHL